MPAEAQPSASSPTWARESAPSRFCRRFGLRVPLLQAPMAVACPPASPARLQMQGYALAGGIDHASDGIAGWVREFRDQSNGGFQINLCVPDPPPVRNAEHEREVRRFLRQWGPPVPAEAGDAVPLDFAAQCEALLAAAPPGDLIATSGNTSAP